MLVADVAGGFELEGGVIDFHREMVGGAFRQVMHNQVALSSGDLPIYLHMRGEHHQPRGHAGNMQVMHVYNAGEATHVLA